MTVKASVRYVSVSPQKARLVADQIRGRLVSEALAALRFTRKRVAKDFSKLLKAAVANAATGAKGRVDVDKLYVSSVTVDGASLKMRRRTLPAPMGRAYRFVRRQSHIEVRLEEKTR